MRNAIVTITALVTLIVVSCVPPDEDDQDILEDVFDEDDWEDENAVTDEEWALVCEAQNTCEALCEFDNDFARRVYETSSSREKRHECAQTWADHGNCNLFMSCLEE